MPAVSFRSPSSEGQPLLLQRFLEGEWQSQQVYPPQHMIFRWELCCRLWSRCAHLRSCVHTQRAVLTPHHDSEHSLRRLQGLEQLRL